MYRKIVVLAICALLVAGLSIGNQAQKPEGSIQPVFPCEVWPIPVDDILQFALEKEFVKYEGQKIPGTVTIRNPTLLLDKNLPTLGDLRLVIQIWNPTVAVFPNGEPFMTHIVDRSRVAENKEYQFSFTLVGRSPGRPYLTVGWAWCIFTEGCCAVAINGVYIGCKSVGQLNSKCVCKGLNNLPPPGSWCCRVHPKTFRITWRKWGCKGPSPY